MLKEKGLDQLFISTWCHVFVRNDIAALLNRLTLNVVYLPRVISDELLKNRQSTFSRQDIKKKYGSEILTSLLETGLFVNDPEYDAKLREQIGNALQSQISVEMMYLLVSDACNLKCTYCFEDAPKKPANFKPENMTKEVAQASIDFFGRLANKYGKPDKSKVIHFYGGEPLINFGVVKSATKYIRRLEAEIFPYGCDLVIITNGILVTEEIAAFLAENNITVGLSVDGPESVNNLYRLPKNKRINVYKKIAYAYKILKKQGVKIGFSVTLTPEAINHFDEFLNFFVFEFGICDGISLNILHYNNFVKPTPDYYVRAAECQIRAFELFREKGIYEERMMRKVQAFVDRHPIYADCGVVGSQIVVSPDGQVGVCQDFVKPRTYFQGSVTEKSYDPVQEDFARDWRGRSPLFMEQCLNCEAIAFCGGGCPASVQLRTGNRWEIDERICPHSKLSLEWLVWDAYPQQAQFGSVLRRK